MSVPTPGRTRLLLLAAFSLALLLPMTAQAQDTEEAPEAEAPAITEEAEETEAPATAEEAVEALEEAEVEATTAPEPDMEPELDPLAAVTEPEADAEGEAPAPLPLWIIDIADIRLTYERFGSSRDRDEYSSVQDDRVRQVDSSTLGVRVDTRLTLEERIAISYFQLLAVYRRQTINGLEDPVELEDLLRLEAGSDVRALSISLWQQGELMPSLAARYTTEFTPEDVVDPETSEVIDERRRSVLRGSAGFVARLDGDLQEIRLSGFAERNFTAFEPYTVAGISFSAIHSHDFGNANWRNTLEADYFFPSDRDGPTHLRYTVAARTSLSMPLFAGLSAGLFASIYGFQGAIPETEEAAYTTLVGAEFGLRRRIEIAAE